MNTMLDEVILKAFESVGIPKMQTIVYLDLIKNKTQWYVIESNSCPAMDFIYADTIRLSKNLAEFYACFSRPAASRKFRTNNPPILLCLVIILFGIHIPNSIFRFNSLNNMFHGGHGSKHGMVLVIILMHAIPPDKEQVLDSVGELPDDGKLPICSEVRRIGLLHPHDLFFRF